MRCFLGTIGNIHIGFNDHSTLWAKPTQWSRNVCYNIVFGEFSRTFIAIFSRHFFRFVVCDFEPFSRSCENIVFVFVVDFLTKLLGNKRLSLDSACSPSFSPNQQFWYWWTPNSSHMNLICFLRVFPFWPSPQNLALKIWSETNTSHLDGMTNGLRKKTISLKH